MPDGLQRSKLIVQTLQVQDKYALFTPHFMVRKCSYSAGQHRVHHQLHQQRPLLRRGLHRRRLQPQVPGLAGQLPASAARILFKHCFRPGTTSLSGTHDRCQPGVLATVLLWSHTRCAEVIAYKLARHMITRRHGAQARSVSSKGILGC